MIQFSRVGAVCSNVVRMHTLRRANQFRSAAHWTREPSAMCVRGSVRIGSRIAAETCDGRVSHSESERRGCDGDVTELGD